MAFLRPDDDSVDGGWLNQAGNNTNLYQSIDEDAASLNDGDYIQSPTNPVNEICKIRLSDPAGALSEPFVVRYRFNNTGGAELTVRLMQGTTEIASWVETGSGWTTQPRTLSTAQFNAMGGDYTNLFIELKANSGAPADPTLVLDLDFTAMAGTLDSRITFTRASPGTYYNSSGVLSSVSSNVPRFDYNPATLAARGLLIEEQRTNILLGSAPVAGVYWSLTDVSQTPNATTAPDGTTTATLLTASGSAAQTYQAATIATGDNTWSIYAKAGTSNWIALSAYVGGGNVTYFNLAAVTVGTSAAGNKATIEDVGNGWRRCTVTRTAGGTSAYLIAFIVDGDNVFSATIGKTAYFWGAQLELGNFASSFIVTTTASETRSPDNAGMTGTNFSSWFGTPTEGTIVFHGDLMMAAFGQRVFNFDDGTGTNDVIDLYEAGGYPFGFCTFRAYDAGSTQWSIETEYTPGTSLKYAAGYKVNDVAVSIDGNAVIPDPTATVPTTLNRLDLGHFLSGSRASRIHFAKFQFYNVRKTNTELRALVALYPTTQAGLYSWWDAYATAKSITEASTAVSLWSDSATGGNNLAPVTTSPSYQATGFNGLRTIRFQATFNSDLAKTGIVKAATNIVTIFGVMLVEVGNGRPFAIEDSDDGSDIGPNSILIYAETLTNLQIYNASAARSSAAIPSGRPFRFCAVCDGANATLYINNVAGSTGAMTNSIGASGTHILRMTGSNLISELGVFWGVALDATQRANLDAYLVERWKF